MASVASLISFTEIEEQKKAIDVIEVSSGLYMDQGNTKIEVDSAMFNAAFERMETSDLSGKE
jgi:hypothetical protein